MSAVVVDASVIVACLTTSGAVGAWAEAVVEQSTMIAPHLMPVEVTNILRRSALQGSISDEAATIAHDDLLGFRIELVDHRPFAERIWELRPNVTSYDAWYVALAESLEVELATLDQRLAAAPGPRCRFLVPPT